LDARGPFLLLNFRFHCCPLVRRAQKCGKASANNWFLRKYTTSKINSKWQYQLRYIRKEDRKACGDVNKACSLRATVVCHLRRYNKASFGSTKTMNSTTPTAKIKARPSKDPQYKCGSCRYPEYVQQGSGWNCRGVNATFATSGGTTRPFLAVQKRWTPRNRPRKSKRDRQKIRSKNAVVVDAQSMDNKAVVGIVEV
jgi:hypothetical protein